MVFDFFRDRSQEGFDPIGNLAGAAETKSSRQGSEAEEYTTQTNKAPRGLIKVGINADGACILVSRQMTSWKDLQDILLQADRISTHEDVVAEVKSLREL
jgi:hypothetical protein